MGEKDIEKSQVISQAIIIIITKRNIESLDNRINQSEYDFRNGRFKSSDQLFAKFK